MAFRDDRDALDERLAAIGRALAAAERRAATNEAAAREVVVLRESLAAAQERIAALSQDEAARRVARAERGTYASLAMFVVVLLMVAGGAILRISAANARTESLRAQLGDADWRLGHLDPAPRPGVGTDAPEIRMTALDGSRIGSETLAGRVYVVMFWATWSEPSTRELEWLGELQRRSMDITVVAVSQDSERANVVDFLARHPTLASIVWDDGRWVAERFAANALPMTFIVDRLGVIRYVLHGHSGDASTLELQAQIRALVAER